jgi:hypothetical protein
MKLSRLDEITKASVRDAFLEVYASLLEEKEQTKQEKASEEIKDLNLRANKKAKSTDEEEVEEEIEVKTKVEPKDKKPEVVIPEKLPDVLEPESIIKSINVIRSGNSLKDPGVQQRFGTYFDKLSPPEKIALKGFLDGLAQVIAGDVPGEDATSPEKPPYNVSMEDNAVQKTRKDIIKPSTPGSNEPDAPIVVGESANKTWAKNVFAKNVF